MSSPIDRPAYSPSHYLTHEEVDHYLKFEKKEEIKLPAVVEVEESNQPTREEPQSMPLVRSPKFSDISWMAKKV